VETEHCNTGHGCSTLLDPIQTILIIIYLAYIVED
jgi:hypothetical protein